MPTLRQLTVRLASSNEGLRPTLLPLLKTADRSAFVQGTIKALLSGWKPKPSAHGYEGQLASYLAADRFWVKSVVLPDYREAHRHDYKIDWALWIREAVLDWAYNVGGVPPAELENTDYTKVVKLIVAQLDSKGKDPESMWAETQSLVGKLTRAIDRQDAAMVKQLAAAIAASTP